MACCKACGRIRAVASGCLGGLLWGSLALRADARGKPVGRKRFWCNLGRWEHLNSISKQCNLYVNNHEVSPIYTVAVSYYYCNCYCTILRGDWRCWTQMVDDWHTWPTSFSLIAFFKGKVGGFSIPFAEFPSNVEAGFTSQWTLILFIWLLRLTCTRRGCHWQSQSAKCQMPIPC